MIFLELAFHGLALLCGTSAMVHYPIAKENEREDLLSVLLTYIAAFRRCQIMSSREKTKRCRIYLIKYFADYFRLSSGANFGTVDEGIRRSSHYLLCIRDTDVSKRRNFLASDSLLTVVPD